jgi:Ca2+-binding RTX toxin-like protein
VNGQLVLQVVGTNGADHVTINEQGNGKIKVHAGFLNDQGGHRTFSMAGLDYVEVALLGGDDKATISGGVSIPSVVDGGKGNDDLKGGGAGAVLIGGLGNDRLNGGGRHSILIGSAGSDDLNGGGKDDILIGGRTLYDSGADENKLTNDAALIRLLQEWSASGTAAQRKARIEAGVDGVFLRLGESVFDDQTSDTLGGGGGADWFWVFLNDVARDYHSKSDLRS